MTSSTPLRAVEVPARMRHLPVDKHGRPVPWFAAWIDGVPDFRVVEPGMRSEAFRFGRCWVCGGPVGSFKVFVIGPMCAVNRTTAEPPCHRDCAIYSARACPFLAVPSMHRREGHKPEGTVDPPGLMIRRNPGVALVWVTKSYRLYELPEGGVLVELGDPSETLWYAHGRPATRAEVLASIDSGLPILRAEAERESPAAVAELAAMHTTALAFVPAGADDAG